MNIYLRFTFKYPYKKIATHYNLFLSFFATVIAFLLILLITSPLYATNQVPQDKPFPPSSYVVRDFSPVNHSPVNTGEPYITDDYEVSSGYLLLGKVFDYETGFGRVTVQAKGTMEKVAVKVLPHTEIATTYFHFGINSHFAGSQAGNAKSSAKLFSVKTFFPTKPVGAQNFVPLLSSPKFGIQYKFLNSNTVSHIHFIDLFGTTSFGTINATAGLTSYFGKDVETEIGTFINISHNIGSRYIHCQSPASRSQSPDWERNEIAGSRLNLEPTCTTKSSRSHLTLFAEYNSLDFMKTVQNYLLAPSTKNVGIINTSSAPKDAFSLGFSLRLEKNLITRFIVYDLGLQMKPFVEVGFLK